MDIENLTLGEIERVENIAEQSITDLADAKAKRGALYSAIAFVITQRDDPSFTYEDAKKLTMADINRILSDSEPEAKKA